MNDPRLPAMFTRSHHNNLSIFVFSHDYYEISKRTIRAKVNMYLLLKLNNYRKIQNIYQDNASMDMKLNEFKYLMNIPTSTFWDEKHQPLTIDMTKDKYTGRYRLRLSSLMVPDTSPFYIN